MTETTKKANDKTFRFCTRLHVRVLTGLKAANIKELLGFIKKVPGSSIYYHTHRFLQQHRYLSPEPPNDFAHWIKNALNEEVLAEKIASIDTIQHHCIRSLRNEIVRTIEGHISRHPRIKSRFARGEKAFHFIKSVSLIIPTPYVARDIREFSDILKKITPDSLYFHLFEARLRLDVEANDFSYWLETSLLEGALAKKIIALDPYTYAMEDLRKKIIDIIEERLKDADNRQV
jgi:hypothetical protein